MKITAKAPANIAFIKYWGKKDEKLRLPANGSISMNLSEVFTTTTVEFDNKLKNDTVKIDGRYVKDREKLRVVNHLERIRKIAKVKKRARVESKNNFPRGTGIASSASGFAALTLAASKAAGLNLSEKELSVLARMGSGSACRSIPDGFVEWKIGNTSGSSYAHSLHPANYWSVCDVVAIVGEKKKEVSSTRGHTIANSSPFYKTRISGMREKVSGLKKALKNKDFTKFGEIVEEDAINMHAVMMTSSPPLFYWSPETIELSLEVKSWRHKGIECYFTIDAGPNMHIICKERDVLRINRKLKNVKAVRRVIINKSAIGVRVV